MTEHKAAQILHAVVPDELAGQRLDQVMSALFEDYSRSRLTQWIREGLVTVDDQIRRPKDRLLGGENLALQLEERDETGFSAEPIPLDIVFEDDSMLVLNKPAGLVVHPAAGNWQGTLLNGLLYHVPQLAGLPRAGIVHRLDKDTTGLMVVAKTELAHKSLVAQLQQRTVSREYRAIVTGVLTGGGTVDEPIGRHPVHRTRMAVHPLGKPAITHYRIGEKFRAHTYVKIKLETGRTHQIRVHMAYIHHPIVGDPLYAGRSRIPAGVSETLKQKIRDFPRQALHARRLTLQHPVSDETLSWGAPLPEDMQQLLQALRDEEAAA
ncbi:MAG: 23S rRNA pseudouridine(1911/1915/1917) synthase RluD [Chromatiales bacterium]|jgi:23S rRNA pseudouridine1911/1915/1917 synthase